MSARRYGISLRVLKTRYPDIDIKLNTRKDSPFLKAAMYYFVYYIDIRTDNVFDDSPKITDHFPKISKDSSRLVRRSHERFLTIYENVQNLPKIAEVYGKYVTRVPMVSYEFYKWCFSFSSEPLVHI